MVTLNGRSRTLHGPGVTTPNPKLTNGQREPAGTIAAHVHMCSPARQRPPRFPIAAWSFNKKEPSMTKDKGTGQLFASEELRRAAKLVVEARQARSERERAECLRQA